MLLAIKVGLVIAGLILALKIIVTGLPERSMPLQVMVLPTAPALPPDALRLPGTRVRLAGSGSLTWSASSGVAIGSPSTRVNVTISPGCGSAGSEVRSDIGGGWAPVRKK